MPAVWAPSGLVSGSRACRLLLWRCVWLARLWRVRPGAALRRSPDVWLARPVAGRPPPVAAQVRPAASPRRVLSWPARRPGAGLFEIFLGLLRQLLLGLGRLTLALLFQLLAQLHSLHGGLLFGVPSRIVRLGAGFLCSRELAGLRPGQVRIKAVRMAGEEGIPGFLGADLGGEFIIDAGFGLRIDRLRRLPK